MYVCRLFARGCPCHIGEKYFDPYDIPCMACFYCDYYPDPEESAESDDEEDGGE